MKAMIAALALASTAAPAQDFSWLAGAWKTEAGGRWTEEWWTPPRGGILIGAGFSGKGALADHFEHMRIMRGADGAYAFYGMPRGAPAVAFRLASSTAGQAVFENPTHDFPQRVSYRIEGETLIAAVSLIDGTKEQRWTYRRVR